MRSKFKWIFTLLLAFSIQFSFAQEKTITGVVKENGMPLPGVSVLVKGTTRGTQTDFDGKYSIKAAQGETLEFSYLGFITQTMAVGASNTVNVTMAEDTAGTGLEEVVVTAYGTQKKSAVTGSIAEIKSEEVAKITTGNVLQGTVGKVAGVQVFNNSGMPGDGPQIRMRGIGSLAASAAPLYVVDGVPFAGDIGMINAQDIESITFLKDASAAALYGNRGANGVIIVTTKKGKDRKTMVTVDSKAGFSTRAVREYDIMTGQQEYYEQYFQTLKNGYMFLNNQSSTVASQNAAAGLINGEFGLNYNSYNVPNAQLIDPLTGKLNPNAQLKYDEDWSDFLYGDGLFTQTHVSVSGGTDKTSVFFSAGYEKNDGYVVNSGFEKITSRVKVDSEISNAFKMGMNIAYTHSVQDYLDGYTGGSNYSSPFFWTRTIAPIYPFYLYDNDGNAVLDAQGNQVYDDGTALQGTSPNTPTRPYGQLQHPYATAINDIKEYKTDNVFASGYVTAKLFEGMTFTYTVTADLFAFSDRDMDTPLYGDAASEILQGRISYSSNRRMGFTQQQLLKYNKVFGKHGFDVLLGHETFDRRNDFVSASRSRLFLPDTPYVNQASVIQGNSGYGDAYAVEGFFAQLNYDYDGKYFVNGSIRRDASSNFHPDNRWGTFFGLGAAWRVSKEAFMQDVSWINDLKLKASYGEQGNDNLLITLPYMSLYQLTPTVTNDPNADPIYNPITIGNKEITWETNINFNAGFEASFLNRRLNVDAELFLRRVEDMLYNRELFPSSFAGFTRPENIGDMDNKGIEVTLDADVIKTKDFTLSVNLNATHYKNEVTRLADGPNEGNRQENGIFIRQEGYSAYDFYMRDFAGVNPATGAAMWWTDGLGSNEIPAGAQPERVMLTEDFAVADRYVIGKTAIPDVFGGFGFNAKYKGIDLGVNFAYQFGGYAYDSNWMNGFAPDPGSNFHHDVASSWTVDNPNASLPISTVGDPRSFYGTSSLGLTKSDYLSIQNISIGYTFGSKFTESLGLSSLRLYALTDNVALWSKRQGFDPRMNGVGGTSDNNYSTLRTTSFGINVQF